MSPIHDRSSAVPPAKRKVPLSNLLHQKAFDSSLQPNLIIQVPGGQIIRVNRAACRLFGYSKKKLLTMNRTDIFRVSDASYKKMIKKREKIGHVKAEVSMIKNGGKIFPCEVTSVIFKDQAGMDHSIVTIVDLSERQDKQTKINVQNKKVVADNIVIAQLKADNTQLDSDDWIKSVQQTTYDVIWDWDLIADEIYFGNNYVSMYGYEPTNGVRFTKWIDSFQPEERSLIKKEFDEVLSSGKQTWQMSYEFVCPDQSLCQIVCRARMLRDAGGKAIRAVGVMHNNTKIQRLQDSLESEVRLKEKQLTQAVADAKEIERSNLGRELHDNINQLLGASVLYLELAKTDIKDADIYVTHSLEYIRKAIEEIRKLSKGLTTDIITDFGLTGAIYKMSRDTMQSSAIKMHCDLDDSFEDMLDEKFKHNVFRILQEQLNNIIKHAQASEVRIRFSQTSRELIVLSVRDNGKGFNTRLKSKGIGLSNIISRAKSFQGDAQIVSQPQKGCTLTVRFPKQYVSLGG